MAIKSLLIGLLPKPACFSPFHSMTVGRHFDRFSSSTAQKVDRLSKAEIPTLEKCKAPNNQNPTLEQIQKDPILKKKIILQYENLAEDADFQEVTEYSTSMGLRHLKNKHLTESDSK